MRNAVSHFEVLPINEGEECVGFRLSNEKYLEQHKRSNEPKFKVELRLDELRTLVEKLSKTVKETVAKVEKDETEARKDGGARRKK